MQVADLVFDVLFGHRIALEQRLVAFGGSLRQAIVGLRGRQIGARLVQLAVDLRGFDLGQQIAGFDVRPDIEIPLLQIAAGARKDGRGDEGLHAAGKHHFFRRRGGLGMQ